MPKRSIDLRYGPFWNADYATRAQEIFARLRGEAQRRFGDRWPEHMSLPTRLNVTTPDRHQGPVSERAYVVVQISPTFNRHLRAD